MSVQILGVAVNLDPLFVGNDERELQHLLKTIAAEHGISIYRLKYGGRTRVLVNMRREFAKSARELGYSLPQIGRALGCNHTSVFNLLRRRA